MDREQLRAKEHTRRTIAARLRALYERLASLPTDRFRRLLDHQPGGAVASRSREPNAARPPESQR